VTEENLYTLEEAAKQLKLMECHRFGHDLTNITAPRLAGASVTLHSFRYCRRCKTTFKLVPSNDCEISDEVSSILSLLHQSGGSSRD
jgi:hypothetical protein